MEDFTWDGGGAGPQVGVVFDQFNGPAAVAGREKVDGGWSAPLMNLKRPDRSDLDWTAVELVTTCPAYVLNAALVLRFTGRGRAYFSGVRWEMVEG
jgi:hypothetical protein